MTQDEEIQKDIKVNIINAHMYTWPKEKRSTQKDLYINIMKQIFQLKEKGIKIIITQVMEQKSCHHIYIKAENQWDWLVKGKTFCQLNILSAILFLRKIW